MVAFGDQEQKTIKNTADHFLGMLDIHMPLTKGLGLKRLRPKIYEIRVDLDTRIVFAKSNDLLEWLFVGNHNEVQRFLKHF